MYNTYALASLLLGITMILQSIITVDKDGA